MKIVLTNPFLKCIITTIFRLNEAKKRMSFRLSEANDSNTFRLDEMLRGEL